VQAEIQNGTGRWVSAGVLALGIVSALTILAIFAARIADSRAVAERAGGERAA
jgi:6-phosphogluconate dehydrogenase